MTYSNLKSEQINENLEIVMDYGEILNKNELVNVLLEKFPNTEEKDGILYGEKEGKKYCIYCCFIFCFCQQLSLSIILTCASSPSPLMTTPNIGIGYRVDATLCAVGCCCPAGFTFHARTSLNQRPLYS